MNVILLERVERLGQMGDVVTVKDGYARNFLLPQKKALRATDANKTLFEKQRSQLEADNLAKRAEAEKVAASMNGLKVVMIRAAGESGQLYGSVSSRDVAGAVTEAGVKINRDQIVLDRAVKAIGLHDVAIRLHPEVTVSVAVNIARSEGEAETQFATGSAVVAETELEGRGELELGGALLEEEAEEDATETKDPETEDEDKSDV